MQILALCNVHRYHVDSVNEHLRMRMNICGYDVIMIKAAN